MITKYFRKVVCEVVTPFLGPGYIWFTSGNFTINVMSAIVYFIMWIGLRSRSGLCNILFFRRCRYVLGSTSMKRIIKSLFTVVTVDLSGWFLTPGLIIFMQFLDLERKRKHSIS